MRAWMAVFTVLVAGLSACGGEDLQRAAGTLEGRDVPLRWSADTLWVLGSAQAPDWAAFGEVTALAFDGTGRLHVLDGRASRITVVDRNGGFVRTVGRPGEGPGELRFPSGMTVLPDGRVAVYDAGHGAFVVFDTEGNFVDHVAVDTEEILEPEGPLTVTSEGRILSPSRTPARAGDSGTPRMRPVVAYSVEPDLPHRVLAEAWRPRTPETTEPGPDITGGLRIRLAPVVGFHPALLVAPIPGGGVAMVDSTAWEVVLLGPGGEPVATLRRPLPPRTVTEEIREAERERVLQKALSDPPRFMVSNAAGETQGAAGEMVRRFQEARVAGMGFHEVVPVVERLASDPRGRLWIQRAGSLPGAPGPTDVVTPGGGYVGTLPPEGLRIPDAFGPEGVMAWGELDDLGAPVVVVARRVEGS